MQCEWKQIDFLLNEVELVVCNSCDEFTVEPQWTRATCRPFLKQKSIIDYMKAVL